MTDFDRAAWKHVLKESRDEFDAGQSDAPNFLRAVIAVAESDYTVVDGFKPAVGDGDSEDVASEVVEHLVAASGVLGLNDPVLFKNSISLRLLEISPQPRPSYRPWACLWTHFHLSWLLSLDG